MAKFNYNKSYEDYLKEYYEKEKQRKQYEAQNNPGAYNSQYQSYINDYMGRIANREPFNYDYTTDAKYQAYQREQMRLGQRAMRDTAAQAATLTGGYGNSYGTTAAASMYNQYAQQAANMIPQYEELAYNRWRDEGQDMYNRLAMYQQADATDYGRYRDRVGDFQAMLNYYTGLADTAYDRGANRYNTDYSNAYNMWRAQQADEQDARDYAEKVRQYNENMAFQREQYAYQQAQDAANAAFQREKFAYQQQQDMIAAKEQEEEERQKAQQAAEEAKKGYVPTQADEDKWKKEMKKYVNDGNALNNYIRSALIPELVKLGMDRNLAKEYAEMLREQIRGAGSTSGGKRVMETR